MITCKRKHFYTQVTDNSKDRQERNASNIYNCKQREHNPMFSANKQKKVTKKLRYLEDQADSAKSEEEAATTIQATYRGYKVRRKFDEVSKN